LHKDVEKLSESHKLRVFAALNDNAALRKLHDMRVELSALWERSSATREQLVVQLQDWCKRAEESGIRALQDFSTRLRSYA
jgi:stearoyl-CoA desaturase (delta-9 desaturase)